MKHFTPSFDTLLERGARFSRPSSALNSGRFDSLCIPVIVSSLPVQGMIDRETN